MSLSVPLREFIPAALGVPVDRRELPRVNARLAGGTKTRSRAPAQDVWWLRALLEVGLPESRRARDEAKRS